MHGVELPKKRYGVEETVRGIEQEIRDHDSFDKLNQQRLRRDAGAYLFRYNMSENTARGQYYQHEADGDEGAIDESVDEVEAPFRTEYSLLFTESEQALKRHENSSDE